MLELPHVIVAAAMFKTLPAPLALPASLASHFVLDMLPHWNPHVNREITRHGHILPLSQKIIYLDLVLAVFFSLVYSIFFTSGLAGMYTSLSCSLMSVLPDVLQFPYYFAGVKHPLITGLIAFQKKHQFDVAPLPGLLFQAFIILLSLLILYN
ncbi:MAG: hypothetical protein UX87_C0036G0002 [Candidatus Amesbacteria bacterium GW2011_GWA1_47_16]|uniref:Uncharacterized protein n=2 Tax=Candidatus Amesiibacteriota TaxID=1752730 RepID=A0A0G1S0P2_9BACT|nr:MAG: hypothetical protein UX87_C0036G0002 [Candidatus Amesbacteria bacterium GW2011_GWA1_47_16]KKU63074.1 MAG: hypothetical protein UX86_C0035G0015 [Candidatus Amesbacteria bacterium GW2011_GWC1_47_15]